jgi:hypothetical protein
MSLILIRPTHMARTAARRGGFQLSLARPLEDARTAARSTQRAS